MYLKSSTHIWPEDKACDLHASIKSRAGMDVSRYLTKALGSWDVGGLYYFYYEFNGNGVRGAKRSRPLSRPWAPSQRVVFRFSISDKLRGVYFGVGRRRAFGRMR